MDSQQKKQRLQLWTLYNLQFSNNHHNIAVNVTLHLSLKKKKIYSKSNTILQYSNKEKVPENPKRPKPFIHTQTVLLLWFTQLWHTGKSYTQPQPWTQIRLKWSVWEINGNWNGMCCEKTWESYLFYMRTGSHNVSLDPTVYEPYRWENSPETSPSAVVRLSHADTNHTEYSYTALYEAHRVKSKYIRVIYIYIYHFSRELKGRSMITNSEKNQLGR